MIKLFFSFISLIHGLIHLLGFVKSFNLTQVSQLNQEISKPLGLLWLACFILFFISIIIFLLNKDFWWLISLLSILLSQALIITFWQDAKFGTIANIIILIGVIIGYGNWNSNNIVKNELFEIKNHNISNKNIIKDESLSNLPPLVKKWLINSKIIGQEEILLVNLKQKGEMITEVNSKNWMKVTAEQTFNTYKPSFVWVADVNAGFGIHLFGRDKYKNGKGHMLIKLFSLYPIVDSKSKEIDQGTMIRYLAEIIWFPSVALNSYLQWEQISDTKVKVTMNYYNNSVSGIYSFNENGDIISFEAKRYFDRKDGATLENWFINIDTNSYKDFQGIRIPTKSSVTWKLKEGDFTWYKLEIDDVKYN
jgi:hypothetical protein